tara:strand:- start:509 stop:643 length:135 start_codon:yes stop_codon:yes gene_type:complete
MIKNIEKITKKKSKNEINKNIYANAVKLYKKPIKKDTREEINNI